MEGRAAMREDMVGRGAVREGGAFDSGLFLRGVSEKDKEDMVDARGSEVGGREE
jgi:hypothetical protein